MRPCQLSMLLSCSNVQYPAIRTGKPPKPRSRDNSSSGGATGSAQHGNEPTLPMQSIHAAPKYFTGASPNPASPKLYESPKAGTVANLRGSSYTGGQHYKQQVTYGARQPLRKDASWFAMMVCLAYLAACIYYLYIRVAFTLDMKDRW